MKIPRWFYYAAGAVLVVFLGFTFLFSNNGDENLATATASYGSVERIISVSGFLESNEMAVLGFPKPVRVAAISAKEGAVVQKGDILAVAGSSALAAERTKAVALLQQAEANREKLLNGITAEAKNISSTTVEQARIAYENTQVTETEKVRSARAALYSTNLEARSADVEENAVAPTVSGSFTCTEAGTYYLEVYSSDTDSGYSFTYSGKESGRATLSTEQPAALGDCGLSLLFDEDSQYRNSEWVIEVPNTRGSSYTQLERAYELAKAQEVSNVASAEYVYRLAEDAFLNDIASPRTEDLLVANASVLSAQADVARVDALIGDEALFAPFDGIVADISVAVGEIASTEAVTLVANGAFTLVARVPEIDIAKLSAGQDIVAYFDANANSPIAGKISSVSPAATLIDGVAYFETNIELSETPDWLRDGLNADIDIVLESEDNALRIPNRYITEDDNGQFYVRLQQGKKVASTSVDVLLRGTNGYTAINGLSEGDVVVAN